MAETANPSLPGVARAGFFDAFVSDIRADTRFMPLARIQEEVGLTAALEVDRIGLGGDR